MTKKSQHRLQMLDKQQAAMKESGFYIHYIPDNRDHPSGMNAHTHGLRESCKHPDFQIMLAIPPETAAMIFHGLVRRIKNGETFGSGGVYSGVMKSDHFVRMENAIENSQTVLRIIFPEESGELAEDKMQFKNFKDQYVGVIRE